MQKRVIENTSRTQTAPASWLDLEELADVEVTSERADATIEQALLLTRPGGWRSGKPGEQVIRICFSYPVDIRHIQLVFSETEVERTQELALYWLPKSSDEYREIVRQQYVFSPPGTTRQVEDYRAELQGLVALELRINPDIKNRTAVASLQTLRLAGSPP